MSVRDGRVRSGETWGRWRLVWLWFQSLPSTVVHMAVRTTDVETVLRVYEKIVATSSFTKPSAAAP